MKNKPATLFFLILLMCPFTIGAQTKVAANIVATIPEIGIDAFSTYSIIASIDGLRNGLKEYSNLNASILISSIFIESASLISSYRRFWGTEYNQEKLLNTSRILYLSSLLPSLLYSIFDGNAEGENRVSVMISCGIPAALGYILTYLPRANDSL